jgi:sulfotransferase
MDEAAVSTAAPGMEEEEPCYRLPAMPLLTISSPVTVAACAAFSLRSTDIFICSYPKSGTTWLQHITISLLLSHLEHQNATKTTIHPPPPTLPTLPPYKHVSDYAPFFEIDAHWTTTKTDESGGNEWQLIPSIQENQERIGRRIFNTHLRYDMLPSTLERGATSSAKFIYIIRSPIDVCVSFYHHLSHQVQGGYQGDWDDFYQSWLLGDTLPYGEWDHHVLSYASLLTLTASESDDPPVNTIRLDDGREFLFLLYEDLMDDLPTAVGQLVEFLGLQVSVERQQSLLPTFSFDSMKSNIDQFQPKSVQWRDQFSFLRRGKAGLGSSVLTENQRADFARRVEHSALQRLVSTEPKSKVLSKIATMLAV